MSPTIRRCFASIIACGVMLFVAGNASAFGDRGFCGGCGASCPTCGCQACDYGCPTFSMPCQSCGFGNGGCGCDLRYQAFRGSFGFAFRPFFGYNVGCRGGCSNWGGYSNAGCSNWGGYYPYGGCSNWGGYSSCGCSNWGGNRYGNCSSCGFGFGGLFRGCGNGCRSCFGSCEGCGNSYQPSFGGRRPLFGGCGLFGSRRCSAPVCDGCGNYGYGPFVQAPFGYYPTCWSNIAGSCNSGMYMGCDPSLVTEQAAVPQYGPVQPNASTPQYAPAPQYIPTPSAPPTGAPSDAEPLPTPRKLEPGHTLLEPQRLPVFQPAGYMPNR